MAKLDATTLNNLAAELRPSLHRYCARMVGSAIDGEDVVQEALAKALEALPHAGDIERPQSWLFRIAHNAALDALRRRKRQAATGGEADLADFADPAAAADARIVAAANLAAFLLLPPSQRSCVALVDVLGHSLAETAGILGLSVAAAKAALHRGRARLREFAAAPEIAPPLLAAAEKQRLRDYADRFNARDFDALRALLAEDVRLELVNRTRLAGRKDVAVYFTRYSGANDWKFSAGLAEGRPALLVSDPADPAGALRYIVLLGWSGERIAEIRDFRFALYIAETLAAAPF